MEAYSNNQEVFDKVARHLLTQKIQAKVNGQCLYRGPNNTMCGIGCLIPDDLYDLDIEGAAVMDLLDSKQEKYREGIVELFTNCNPTFLSDLQLLHDDTDDDGDWYQDLEGLAEDYDLDTTVLDEFQEDA